MKKTIFIRLVAGILLLAGAAQAEKFKVKWVLRGGESWEGFLSGRESRVIQGEEAIFIQLKRSIDPNPVGVGVNTIKELTFEVDLDMDDIDELIDQREYKRAAGKLERAVTPFVKYDDIPSNLTQYHVMLMELFQRLGDHEKTMVYATKVTAVSRDLKLQEKSRMYQALALIDGGKTAEAEALIEEYGWNKELSAETPPAQLYISAKLLKLKKQYSEAMMCVSKVIVFHSQEMEWMQPAELLCAELYTEMGMFDSAEEVCKQIELLYKDSPEYDRAAQLKIRIEELRTEQKRVELLKEKDV